MRSFPLRMCEFYWKGTLPVLDKAICFLAVFCCEHLISGELPHKDHCAPTHAFFLEGFSLGYEALPWNPLKAVSWAFIPLCPLPQKDHLMLQLRWGHRSFPSHWPLQPSWRISYKMLQSRWAAPKRLLGEILATPWKLDREGTWAWYDLIEVFGKRLGLERWLWG